jgi:hypothetical protein
MTEKTFRQALIASGTPDLVVKPATPDVYYQHRILPEGDLYFLVNNANAPLTRTFTFRGAKGRCELWDPWEGTTRPAELSVAEGGSALDLTLGSRRGLFVLIIR